MDTTRRRVELIRVGHDATWHVDRRANRERTKCVPECKLVVDQGKVDGRLGAKWVILDLFWVIQEPTGLGNPHADVSVWYYDA